MCNISKSPGPDKINMCVIKIVLQLILETSTDIINCPLITYTLYHNVWKEAELIPLLKEGNYEVA